jgi:putative transposase
MRKEHSSAFKTKVALEAYKEAKTISEIATSYEIHPEMVRRWKKHLTEHAEELFSESSKKANRSAEELQGQLYQQIGQLKVELDWLKKKSGFVS